MLGWHGKTWEYASKILKMTKNPEDISRAVGRGACTEFVAFWKLSERIPDPKELLMQPEKAELPRDISLSYALFSTIASIVRHEANQRITNNFLLLIKRLNEVLPDYLEIGVMALSTVLSSTAVFKQIRASPYWKELGKLYYKYLGIDGD